MRQSRIEPDGGGAGDTQPLSRCVMTTV